MIRHIYLGIWLTVMAMISLLPAKPVCCVELAARDDLSSYAVEVINQIRLDPLSYAEGLGYHRDAVLLIHPWLAGVPSQGLAVVQNSDYLREKALAENIPGSELSNAVSSSWQEPVVTTEIGGSVSFLNFMPPEQAVKIILDNQFKKELEAGGNADLVLLGGDFSQAGAAIGSGSVLAAPGQALTYHVSVVMGSSFSKAQAQVMNMMNQFRANPAGTLRYLAVGWAGLPSQCGPFFQDSVLFQAADLRLYADNMQFLSQSGDLGYLGSNLSEVSAMEFLPKAGDDYQVLLAFFALAKQEMLLNQGTQLMLNPGLNEAGVAFNRIEGKDGDYIKLSVAGGNSLEPEKEGVSKVYGLIYSDPDLNRFYTPGEGVDGCLVGFFNKHTQERVAITRTNAVGQYQLELPSGAEYIVITGTPASWAAREIFLGNEDLYIDLIYRQDG